MKKYKVYLALALLIAVVTLTLFGWRSYIRTIEKNEWGELRSKTTYTHHYALIPDDPDSALWRDISESAGHAGDEAGAYVEIFGQWAVGDYTPLEYLEIARAAKVDGIIIRPDGTAKMRDAINAAEAEGIPVVTVLDDDTSSSRKSFVGINSYQMGTTYGNEILDCIDEETRKITVLLNQAESGKDLIFKELKSTVQNALSQKEQDQIAIEPLTIKAANNFDAEEVIRDLINVEATRPDILVCMNETASVCAYHAMVDFNLVGSIDIIGYYQSDTVLNAIEKGIVPMAVTIDTKQIGARVVDALEEYYDMGYTSNYFSVDLNLITKENVQQFRQKTSE